MQQAIVHFFVLLLATPAAVAADEIVGAWNFSELERPPAMRWVTETGPVRKSVCSSIRIAAAAHRCRCLVKS